MGDSLTISEKQSTKTIVALCLLPVLFFSVSNARATNKRAKPHATTRDTKQSRSIRAPKWKFNIARMKERAKFNDELGDLTDLEIYRKAVLLIALNNTKPDSAEERLAREELKEFYKKAAQNPTLNKYACLAERRKRFESQDDGLLSLPRPELSARIKEFLDAHRAKIDKEGNWEHYKPGPKCTRISMEADGSIYAQDDRMILPSCSLPPILPVCKPGSEEFERLLKELPELLPGSTEFVPADKADEMFKRINEKQP